MGNRTSQHSYSSRNDASHTTATNPTGELNSRSIKTQSLSGVRKLSSIQRDAPESSSLRHSIVTVHERSAEVDTLSNDTAMIALQNVRQFYPILRETIRNPALKEMNTITKLDVSAALSLVTKYQLVAKEGVTSVTRNQQQLAQRVVDMDYAIGTLHQILQEKSRKLAKQTEQLASISQIKALLNSSGISLRTSEETLNRINNCLPPEHRLGSLNLTSHLTPHT